MFGPQTLFVGLVVAVVLPLLPSLAHAYEVPNETIPSATTTELSNLRLTILDSGNSTSTRVTAAQDRAAIMEDIAPRNPTVFLSNVIFEAERSGLPSEVEAYLEEEIVETHGVRVLHVDDFTNPENSRDLLFFHYSTSTPDTALYPVISVDNILTGTTINITGYTLDNLIVADTVSIISMPSLGSGNMGSATGTQRLLVMLVKRPSETRTITRQEMQTRLSSGSFQNYFNEASDGQISFTVDVTDWISMSSYTNAGCGQPRL